MTGRGHEAAAYDSGHGGWPTSLDKLFVLFLINSLVVAEFRATSAVKIRAQGPPRAAHPYGQVCLWCRMRHIGFGINPDWFFRLLPFSLFFHSPPTICDSQQFRRQIE